MKLRSALRVATWAVAFIPFLAWGAQAPDGRWAADFAQFAQADAQRPQQGGVVFVGSSSIRLWDDLEKSFDRFPVVKRGFGGSTMSDCVENVGSLVSAYRPRLVVVYAGENDLAEGAAADEVVRAGARLTACARRQPAAHIAFVSIKPSPLRAALLPAVRDANARIRADLASVPNAQFIDVHTLMLDADGRPRADLFGSDRLHMNAAGYALWRREINARLP